MQSPDFFQIPRSVISVPCARKFVCVFANLFLTLFFQTDCQASNLVERPRRDLLPQASITDLSPATRELAEQLEIWTMLVELYDKKNPASFERKVLLRQKIRETLLESHFDAESVQAEAQREATNLSALRQSLSSKRDRSVEVNNGVNFIASGTLNTVGSVLGFSAKTPPFSGNLLQMLSGVVSTGMSTYALKQNNGGKTVGTGHSTVVAELFGRPSDERSSYPESVWRFFHGNSMEEPGKTRIQLLEERWISRHELEPHGSSKEQLKLDFVCGIRFAKKQISIEDLTDEINIIADISAMASLMSHHLRDLLRMIDSDVN